MPVIRKWLGMETKGIPATSGQFEQLTEYVNHQQTEILKRQTQLMEAILEIVRDIRRKQEEYDKYGINARCNSDKSE